MSTSFYVKIKSLNKIVKQKNLLILFFRESHGAGPDRGFSGPRADFGQKPRPETRPDHYWKPDPDPQQFSTKNPDLKPAPKAFATLYYFYALSS
jgi:hypothetical protein